MDRQAADRLNARVGLLAVCVAALLVLLKLWAWWVTGALSVAASLVDNLLDLIVSGAGLAAILYAARPADDEHRFGHSSAEDLAALAQAAFVTLSAIAISLTAFRRLLGAPAPLTAETEGILAMLAAVLLTLGLVLVQRATARRTGSKVIAADSLHYLSDLLPGIGAIAALALSRRFGWAQIDAVVALLTAGILLRGAWTIGRDAVDALMDRGAGRDVQDTVARLVAARPDVLGFHDLKTRRAGTRIFIQMHIELDGSRSLHDAHATGAALRQDILDALPDAEVIIHKDPA
ncbi:cation diffusion facilitator family transporter [Oceanomicrobium pacificus]|uniref:Cation diffusion facilitator family transporter n=1 Tax=Oceanomicrobium pacificus TaxID=2692916 RepID=A0A6B0TJ61_9RHOB|nr:cation diffusion facilitator family transporter [Oceanomicrobium pacificus]MXU64450.1 cation diffusion facilitator family transporter [Oceanomicrobium pacificus]